MPVSSFQSVTPMDEGMPRSYGPKYNIDGTSEENSAQYGNLH